MYTSIKGQLTNVMLASVALFVASAIPSNAGPASAVKTSQHPSFKPENFERLAVIVKPIQAQGYRTGRGQQPPPQQSQTERMVEQGFMRTLITHGYTLVSRTDLDAALVEKGLDNAHLTDEKLGEEAGKLLHVSAIVIVSVDDFNVTPVQVQQPVSRMPGTPSRPSGYNSQTVYQFVASISARLVQIDNNMVMWTGDMTINRPLATQSQDSVMLGSMAEAIGTAFPGLSTKKD